MSRRVIIFLVFAAFVTTFSNFQHPVTPVFLESIQLDASKFGFLFAFMALGLSVTAPIAGRIIDKYGTRLPMFFGLLFYAVAQVLFVSTSNIVVLVVYRFLAGIGVGFVFPTFITGISKITSTDNRAKAMSIYAGISIAFVSIGYKLGGLLYLFMNVKEIFYLHGALIILLAFASLLIENIKPEMVSKGKVTFKSFDKDTLKIFFLFFLTSGIFMSVTRFTDVLIIDSGYEPNDIGNFVLATGAVGLVTTFIILPRLSKTIPEYRLMRYALLLSSVTLYVTFLIDNLWIGLYSVFMIYMLAKSSYAPMHNSFVSKFDEEKQGEIIGISESAKMFGMFVGPIASGYLYAISANVMYSILAIMLFIAYLIGRTLNGSKVESTRES